MIPVLMQVALTPPAADPAEPVEPFVSIVTVSLNAAASIADTIASVAAQRVGFAVEHICVDGGSVDATRAIIDHWAARTPRMVRIYEPDSGIFDAMNKGLRAATGEYVLFLNADDFLVAPDTLAMVMAGLAPGADDNPDLILGDVSMGKLGAGGVWRHRRVPRLLGSLRGCGLFPLHQGQFTKRRLLNAIGGFNPTLRIASDVIQYYDLERRFRPTMRFVRGDVAFMRAGGAANAGLKARYRATREFYRHLTLTYSPIRAAFMVTIKTLQSLEELRLGRCPHARWFASAVDGAPLAAR
ncbi:MAG TPA: glycosyltransferase family 2 protein [Steroidobacteraceae bacterium]|nr:glycosyltransferase family 2 protein [Steroidobacteraceae bacterium]